MITKNDFIEKKIIIVFPKTGDKMTFKNDNFTVVDCNNKIKIQVSCYKIFCIFLVGGFVVTTGLIEKSKRFGFSIILMTNGFKVYETINFKMEGNTLLREKQYNSKYSAQIGKRIIINKIENQKDQLLKIRNAKNREGIILLDEYILKLLNNDYDSYEIMGIEGNAAKVYFNRMFGEFNWHGRQPRVKRDSINLLLDIGYTLLFNYIEGVLNLYGFDIYKGNLHKEFYKRKSLVCDIIEPFRPIIDYAVRKGINLNQFDFTYTIVGQQYTLDWKQSEKFITIILKEINLHSKEIYDYIQSYYRWIMKGKEMDVFPKARLKYNDID